VFPLSISAHIQDLFQEVGRVRSCRLTYDRAGRSDGVAYVEYDDPRNAEAAVEQFDGAQAAGAWIFVTLC